MHMEQIKSSTMSTFRTILYSRPHLLMSFIDRHILMLTIATYIQLDRLSTKGTEESAIYGRGHVSATIRNSENNIEKQ